MVVFSAVVEFYVHRWFARGAGMARVRVHLLQEGAGAGPERSQAEGAEGGSAEQAGVRGDLHDRGEGLGRRTYLGTDHHRPHPGKSL